MVEQRERVFVSYTTEFERHPQDRTFLDAALDTLVRNGYRQEHMRHFPARDRHPLDVCREKVRGCDIYVGVIGFRYGSLIPDGSVSYTEDEFDTATLAGLPRLLFLLKQPLTGPECADENPARITAFRKRIKARSGLYIAEFETPDGLALALLQALIGQPRAPWHIPPLSYVPVPRPELTQRAAAALTSGSHGGVAVLYGAAGFGKSTVAAMVCKTKAIRDHFPGGLVWARLSPDDGPEQLPNVIADLCLLLSGRSHQFHHVEPARYRLASLLEERPHTLLVLDGVCSREQVEAFILNEASASRLITTRQRSLVPPDAEFVEVNELDEDEERALLASHLPELDRETEKELRRQTRGWAVVSALANAYLRDQISYGVEVNEAARNLTERLRTEGPGTPELDGDSATMIESNLSLLAPNDGQRYLELGIFPEATDIPVEVVALLWSRTGGLSLFATRRLLVRLAALSLITGYPTDRPASGATLRLHGVLHSHLRTSHGAVLGPTHIELLGAAAALLDGDAAAGGTTKRPWWTLPEEHAYLWRHLAYHLTAAGLTDELAGTVLDLRWTEERSRRFGIPDALADLAALEHLGHPLAAGLARALSRSAHLLGPVTPEHSHADILLSRLRPLPELTPLVREMEPRPPGWRAPTHTRLTCLVSPDVTSALVRVIRGHESAVTGVAIAPSETWLATASTDGTVRLWEVDGTQRLRLADHGRPTTAVAISPDGTWFATADDVGRVRTWGADGAARAVLAGHTSEVHAMAIARDGRWLVTVSNDRTAQVWDIDTSASIICRHRKAVIAVAVGPEGNWFATVEDGGTLRTWSASGEPRHHARHDTEISGVMIRADGDLVTVGQGVYRWSRDLDRCEVIDTDQRAHTARPGPDDAWLVAVGEDNVARVIGFDGRRASFPGHARRLTDVSVATDGTWFATASEDRTVRLWRTDHGDELTTVATTALTALALAPDERWLLTASRDQPSRIWDGNGALVATLSGPPAGQAHVAIAPDSSWLATSTKGMVELWRSDGTRLATVPSGRVRRRVTGLAIASDGRTVVLSRRQGKAVELGGTWCPGVVIAPGGGWLATTGDQGIEIWDAGPDLDPHRLRSIDALRPQRTDAPRNAVVRLVRLDGDPESVDDHALLGHHGWVADLEIAPAGDWLASAGEDGTVRLWRPDGRPLATIGGHTAAVVDLAIAPDGEWLATAGRDGLLGLWSRHGLPVIDPVVNPAPLTGVTISPDGRYVATTAADGTATLWDPAGRPLATMRTDVPLRLPVLSQHRLYVGGFGLFAFEVEPGSPT